MAPKLFVVIGFALAWSQDTNEARHALAIVRQSDGTIVFDDKSPGKPVVGINL